MLAGFVISQASPWLADGPLLPVSARGLPSVLLCVLISSYKGSSHTG